MTTTDTLETLAKAVELGADAPDVGNYELVPAKQKLPAAEYDAKLDEALQELDLSDSNSVIYFGSKAQQELTKISDQMLSGVKSKDAGPAGNMLSEMVTVIRGFDMEKLNPNRKRSFWDKILFRVKPIAKFTAKYEEVTEQVETIAHALEKHKETLLIDIKSLDKLYDANLNYFHNLEFYIDAGEKKIQDLDTIDIPALVDKANQTKEMLDAQALQDLRAVRDDLERRVHDLRLTRQVAMQSLPSIRMVQNNDKGLVTKINSTMVNTIPLWRQQLAQAITIFRSNAAAGTLKQATDLTNDLLKANAENLNQANQQARRQIERGVFDIESVKQANETLIKTIEEGLQISAEGKKARADALVQLESMENELKETLKRATTELTPKTT